jgi:hypothetical protein
MKVNNVTINWMLDYGNDPEIEIHVDELPKFNELVFNEPVPNMYFGMYGDYVDFFIHDTDNETGYGGREFPLKMANGLTKTIKGPWSSSSSIFNGLGTPVPQSMEVTYIDKDNHHYAGKMLLHAIYKALFEYQPKIVLDVERGYCGNLREIRYSIANPKPEVQNAR